ncbi:MAG: hypothetical protein AMS27_14960 [Bacteroides sp. SM23_62_1]|nr:MAG: hypothetical protein AMS27_14960 [Bacteroides sp. SM23_62_1]
MATKKTTSAASKTKKAAAAGTKAGVKKVTASKTAPTEEQIRRKAEEIYHERIARGEHGTAEDDWHKAEKLLKGSKK